MNKQEFIDRWNDHESLQDVKDMTKDLDTLIQSKAIEFAEQLNNNGYVRGDNKLWYNYKATHDGPRVYHTSEELYEQFKETK